MKNELIAILKALHSPAYPVFLQGTLNEAAAYPPSFFTIWNNETPDGNHYDNDAAAFNWEFSVYFYSNDPASVNTVLAAARTALKSAGWAVQGLGYDVTSDEVTHTGRGIDVYYHQINPIGG